MKTRTSRLFKRNRDRRPAGIKESRRHQRSRLRMETLEDRRLLAVTGITGGGLPHENVQPSLPLNYIIATQGTFPSQNRVLETELQELASLSTDPVLGEIQLFAGNFAPDGWALTDGQILSIAS